MLPSINFSITANSTTNRRSLKFCETTANVSPSCVGPRPLQSGPYGRVALLGHAGTPPLPPVRQTTKLKEKKAPRAGRCPERAPKRCARGACRGRCTPLRGVGSSTVAQQKRRGMSMGPGQQKHESFDNSQAPSMFKAVQHEGRGRPSTTDNTSCKVSGLTTARKDGVSLCPQRPRPLKRYPRASHADSPCEPHVAHSIALIDAYVHDRAHNGSSLQK